MNSNAYASTVNCSLSKLFTTALPSPWFLARFGLFPLSLAATYGIDVSFFSCGYLDVSVPRVRSTCPIHSGRSDWLIARRVSPFGHLRINACLPASRSLSQATASFFASRCQDIHRTPLFGLTTLTGYRQIHTNSVTNPADVASTERTKLLHHHPQAGTL